MSQYFSRFFISILMSYFTTLPVAQALASIYLANNYLLGDSHINWVSGRDTEGREIGRGK
jgi:hypothetical protein